MNQNWQEKRMQQLFRELRGQDEQQAPPFANVLEAALASQQQAPAAWRVWRIAVALLIVVLGSGFFFIKSFLSKPTLEPWVSAPTRVPDLPKLVMSVPPPSNKYAGVGKQPKSKSSQNQYSKKEPRRYARHQQLPTQKLQPAMLISKWQSPTDGLLKVAGAELFKNIPRVGVPLFEMKSFFPTEKN